MHITPRAEDRQIALDLLAKLLDDASDLSAADFEVYCAGLRIALRGVPVPGEVTV